MRQFFYLDLLNLRLSSEDDEVDDPSEAQETLDQLLQGTIDAATTKPSNLNGLIVLHAALRRWSRYAKRAIKLLESEISQPGYMEPEE